jgi:hypothetical protein
MEHSIFRHISVGSVLASSEFAPLYKMRDYSIRTKSTRVSVPSSVLGPTTPSPASAWVSHLGPKEGGGQQSFAGEGVG